MIQLGCATSLLTLTSLRERAGSYLVEHWCAKISKFANSERAELRQFQLESARFEVDLTAVCAHLVEHWCAKILQIRELGKS